MRTGERGIGLIVLGSTISRAYTADELKLLNTLALTPQFDDITLLVARRLDS